MKTTRTFSILCRPVDAVDVVDTDIGVLLATLKQAKSK
jgi:hypothetical protein